MSQDSSPRLQGSTVKRTVEPIARFHRLRRSMWELLTWGIVTVAVDIWLTASVSAQDLTGWSFAVLLSVALVFSLFMVWFCLFLVFRPGPDFGRQPDRIPEPNTLEDYVQHGLGPAPADADAKELYLDLVKRSVVNILYEDPPLFFYDHRREPVLAEGFSLERRVWGEDIPMRAHTMIGLKRLDHLQQCIEEVVDSAVPGDLIETGAYRGGATIFMRAVLRALGVVDRRVFVCDTFLPPAPELPHWTIMPVLQALASIPNRWWRHRFFMFLQRLPRRHRAFPACHDPSESFINFVMWSLRNPSVLQAGERTSLEDVKSRFARYGLLDDQVEFLRGFFADTLPESSIARLAVLRLDGDTYESTTDAIRLLYPKLSPGGYCIVDDYWSFPDCERAICDYRQQQGIDDEIKAIDRLSVFWRKA